jgi:hypothetical protein
LHLHARARPVISRARAAMLSFSATRQQKE